MAVSLDQIPSALRVPLAYIEFSNARAVQGTPSMPYKVLFLGQKLASAPATAGKPVRVLADAHAEQLFGRGSMLAEMFAAAKAANRMVETWAIPLNDAGSGAAATGSLTVAGPATAAGQLVLYIAGRRVPVGVVAADSATTIASNIAAAINAETRLPVTAAAASATVTLTCRWKGVTGNDIDLRLNYYPGEQLPGGVTVTIVAMANGAGNPDISAAIAAFGDEWWNQIVNPYTDSANLALLRAEMEGRFGPLRMQDSEAFMAYRGTHAATSTFGNGLNCQLFTVMGTGTSPTPTYIWAAINAVVAGASLEIDPARPLQTLALTGVLPPAFGDRWRIDERNLLLFDGISTFMVDAGGVVRIERQITTYQTNAFGAPDPSYLDVETLATLAYIRYAVRNRILLKFPRMKLAGDDARFAPGQAIVTPRTIRAELLALFRELEERGLVEDFEQFKSELIVERDASDKNRLNVLMGPNLVNQLRIFAAQIQYNL